jgi:hypothetical protein
MPDQEGIDRSIAETEKELVRLNIKREELIARLQDLRREKTLLAQSGNQIALSFQPPAVTNRSSEEEKITLLWISWRYRYGPVPGGDKPLRT